MKSFLSIILALGVGMATAVTADPLLYVPTGKSNELLVIDPARDRVSVRIPELENAHALAATPDGLYLVAGSMDMVKPQDTPAATKPQAVTADEHQAHHASAAGAPVAGQSFLSVIDVRSGHVVRRIAVPGMTHHAAISPDGKVALAVHTQLGEISITDLAKAEVVARVATGNTANFAVFSSNGQLAYVSNAGAGTVSEIDTRTWQKVRDIAVGKGPEHLVWAAKDNILYVANVLDATVMPIALPDGTVGKAIAVGKSPHGIDVSNDGRWLFVSGKDDGSLTRIELATGVAERAKLAPEPYHVTYLKGLNKLYVSSREAPKIWVLDPDTLSVKSEIDIGAGAVGHQMVILDRPMAKP